MLSKARCTIENIIILKNVIISLSIIHIHLIFLYFSLSEHEANTTELYPKVGPTYLPLLLVVSNFTSTLNNHHKSRIRIIIFKAIPDERRYFHLFPPYFCHVDISWHWSTMQVNMQKHLSAPGRQRAKLLLGNRRGLWAKWSIWPLLQGGNLWPEGYKQVRAIIESFWFLHFIFSSW